MQQASGRQHTAALTCSMQRKLDPAVSKSGDGVSTQMAENVSYMKEMTNIWMKRFSE